MSRIAYCFQAVALSLLLGVAPATHAAETAQPAAKSGELDLENAKNAVQHKLAKDPKNRKLRFEYSKILFAQKDYDAARHQVRYLIKTSPNVTQEAAMRRAYGQVVERDPVKMGLNFAFLPSTNIDKTSSNEIFESLLGDLTIIGGGQEKSGVGARLGLWATYETLVGDGNTLTYGISVNRNKFPDDRLSRYDGMLRASWRRETRNGAISVTPYVMRSLYDEASGINKNDSHRYGASLSIQRYLPGARTGFALMRLEQRDYDEKDYLSGPYGEVKLGLSGRVAPKVGYSLSMGLTHHAPKQDYLVYTGGAVKGELRYAATRNAVVGLNAEYGKNTYEGIYAGTSAGRRDSYASVGVSYRNSKIKVFGNTPKLSCKHQTNWSNVDLFDFKTTDCSFVFESKF